MRPMQRFRSAVAEDMLLAAASISLRALSPCWLAMLSILPATANCTLPNEPAALRFTAAEIESIADIKNPHPPARLLHVGKVQYVEGCRDGKRHNSENHLWTYLIGPHRFEAVIAMPYTYRTRNCWISDGQVPKTPYVAFRRRHTQGMCAWVKVGNGRAWIFGLTFGLC